MQKRVAVETETKTLRTERLQKRIDVTLLSSRLPRRTVGQVAPLDDLSLLPNVRDAHAAFASPSRAPPLDPIAATRSAPEFSNATSRTRSRVLQLQSGLGSRERTRTTDADMLPPVVLPYASTLSPRLLERPVYLTETRAGALPQPPPWLPFDQLSPPVKEYSSLSGRRVPYSKEPVGKSASVQTKELDPLPPLPPLLPNVTSTIGTEGDVKAAAQAPRSPESPHVHFTAPETPAPAQDTEADEAGAAQEARQALVDVAVRDSLEALFEQASTDAYGQSAIKEERSADEVQRPKSTKPAEATSNSNDIDSKARAQVSSESSSSSPETQVKPSESAVPTTE